MAIYTNGTWTEQKKYMVGRSSKIKATDTGHLYDLVFESPVENGMNVKVGDYLGDGLQLREGTFPAIGDKIAFACDVPLIYENYTSADQAEYNYVNKVGKSVKCYEIVEDDVIGFSDYGFTTKVGDAPAFGNYVTVDGNGKWVEVAGKPDTSATGFIGQIMGFETYLFDTIVLVHVVQNKQIA